MHSVIEEIISLQYMFKAIHGLAPTYLSDRIVMTFDVNGYDTRVRYGFTPPYTA